MTNPNQQLIETNPLTSVQYKFEIHNLPSVTYGAQSIILPSMQTDAPLMSTPRRSVPLTGTQLNFDPFNITFLVDDELNNYSELYNWMIYTVTHPFDKATHVSDATLHILHGDLTPNKKITFIDCFPTLVAELPFESHVNDSDVIECSAVFNFAYFKLEDTIDF